MPCRNDVASAGLPVPSSNAATTMKKALITESWRARRRAMNPVEQTLQGVTIGALIGPHPPPHSKLAAGQNPYRPRAPDQARDDTQSERFQRLRSIPPPGGE